MIPYRNCEIFASVIFFFIAKILCSIVYFYREMYKRQPTLTSIPERNENEEDIEATKWVPKKKHEVLKAKYKCLKKLFQVYDASVIGILPETYGGNGYLEEELQSKRRRKKRSHRTKTDACAGTTETSNGDVTQESTLDESLKDSIANSVIRDLNGSRNRTGTSTVGSQYSRHSLDNESVCNERDPNLDLRFCHSQTLDSPKVPYVMVAEKPKLTRFQSFIKRIFGIRPEREFRNYVLPDGHVYAASDSNIYNNYCEKRRRGGFRLRRMKRPKKIQSESALGVPRNPMILSYVQSVQKNYLNDTTPRLCPINGCQMRTYGIINYNDHLNYVHFPEKKYICHYCHDGFHKDHEKFVHENEHLGISKFAKRSSHSGNSGNSSSHKIASDTQTDPNETQNKVVEGKMKKTVSFLDQITDSDTTVRNTSGSNNDGDLSDLSDKRTAKICSSRHSFSRSSKDSSGSSKNGRGGSVVDRCHVRGERFDNRRLSNTQILSHHKLQDLRSHTNIIPRNYIDMVAEDGKIKVHSINNHNLKRFNSISYSSLDSYTDASQYRSDESCASYDPSVVYNPSLEKFKKSSVVNNIVKRVKTGMNPYKWEAGTKIIRV